MQEHDNNRLDHVRQHDQLELNYDYEHDDNCDYHDNTDDIDIMQSDLSVLQWNIRGLLGKKDILHTLMTHKNNQRPLDIGIISETWLTDRTQSFANIPGYHLITSNRTHKKGGGVGLLVSSRLKYRERPDLTDNSTSTENCFIEVLSKTGNIIIGSIYRPPNTNEKEFISVIARIIECSVSEKKEIILGMDHNLDLMKNHLHKNTKTFLDMMLSKDCVPTITKPSRITKSSATLIDNIFISKK